MSPIDRARRRSDALQVLGLRGFGSTSDIRKAYRKLAFELHPDRENGDEARFMEVTAAYDLLRKDLKRRPPTMAEDMDMQDGPAAGQATPEPGPVQPARPAVRTGQHETGAKVSAQDDDRTDNLPDDEDWTLLGRERPYRHDDTEDRPQSQSFSPRSRLHEKYQRLSPAEIDRCRVALDDSRVDGMTDHVPVAMSRRGRRISAHIDTPMAPGANRVALSLCDLQGRRAETQIVVFSSGHGGPGVIDLPEATLAEMFPGARELKLQFALGRSMEDAA